MDMLINDTGLTLVYEPESGFPIVDIVIVHGLQGHPYKTWACKVPRRNSEAAATTSIEGLHNRNDGRKSYHRVIPIFTKKSSGSSSSRPNPSLENRATSGRGEDAKQAKVFWPKDLLPVQCSNARILVYGYDTRVTNYLARPTNGNSIHSHGKDLLFSLAAYRRIDSPLVLIAHSLGGIVVKEMLASSSTSTEDRLRNVVASTSAVIFLGTPHRGSPALATLGDRARSVINAFRLKTNPTLLDALRLKTNDLERAQESFSAVWSQYDFQVKTFQEGLGLTGLNLGPFGKKVVPDESSLLGDTRERSETIQANHMEMCRFTGLDDPNYHRLCGEITSIYERLGENHVTAAHSVDDQSFTVNPVANQPCKNAVMNEREKTCLLSLAFPNMNHRIQSLESPAEGTCSWLFEHETFVSWLTQRDQNRHCGLLWLKGKPGSGKSVLLKEAFFRVTEMSGSQYHVASFSFNAKGDGLEHSPTGMLRSILFQVCSQNPKLLEVLMGSAGRMRTLTGEEMTLWEGAELKRAFSKAVIISSKRIIIFVDGIDECDYNSIRDVAYFWRDVTKIANTAGVQLSVCLSSRHVPAISVNNCPEIIMEDHNHSDIVEFVRRRLGLGMAANYIDQQAIQQKILEKSGGVFLWVALVVTDVLQKTDEGKGLQFLLKHLDSVPQELEDLFSQLLTTAHCSPMVARMFQWALLPTKQLRLHEWHHILAFIEDEPPSSLHQWQQSDTYTGTDEQLERRIAHLSRGLLGFNVRSSNDNSHESADDSMSDRAGAGSLDLETGETRVVQVIHESVRQYFMDGLGFVVLNPASKGNPLAHAHFSIMEVCLNYILIEELDALFEARIEARKLAQRRTNLKSQLERDRARDQAVNVRVLGQARPAWRRASSVASFGSASSHEFSSVESSESSDTHDGRRSPAQLEEHHQETRLPVDDTLPACRERPRPSENSGPDLLEPRNLRKLRESTEDYPLADRWLKDQSVGHRNDSAETSSPASLQSSVNGCSRTLEAHTALLSYAMFELFTHARKADAEGVDPTRIILRLHDAAWDRWKALREDVDERTEFLYFAACLGLSSWLKVDRVWKEDEVISSVRLAVDFEDSKALGKLLDAFPAAGDRSIEDAIKDKDHQVIEKLVTAFPSSGFEREISKKLFTFLAHEPDHVLLQAYLSRYPNRSQENGSTSSIIAMKDILETQDREGRTALHLAVARSDRAIVSVLLGHGADVSAVDYMLHTPLHVACTNELESPGSYLFSSFTARGAIVKLLLSHRARVNAVNALGQTPLLITCSNTGSQPRAHSTPHPSSNKTRLDYEVLNTVDSLLKLNIVNSLLEHGADPTIRDWSGSFPLYEACRTSSMNTPTKLAIVNKLLDYESPVNGAARGGETPLHAACTCSEVEIVEELLRRGAHPTLRDREGCTPLHIASAHSTEQVVETLLSFPGAPVNAADERGATPLHLTCIPNRHAVGQQDEHRIRIIRRLLVHGAKAYTVRDRDGDAPADVVRRNGFAGTLELMAQESCDSPTWRLAGWQGQL